MAGERKGGATGAFRGGHPVSPMWLDESHVKPVFADQLQVTRVGDVFHLTFGQVQIGAPLTGGAPGKAPVEAVLRVVTTYEALDRMIGLLNRLKEDWKQEL